MANETIKIASTSDRMYAKFEASGNVYSGECGFGYSYATSSKIRGALVFQNVQIAKNATGIDAGINIFAQDRRGSQELYCKIWGIDEDNTGPGDPFGRTKTTASNTHNTNITTNEYFGIGVGSIIEEIVSRSGWSPGNSLGFLFEDNGTTTASPGNFVYDYFGGSSRESFLNFRVGSEPNFTPTNKSVSAPTFPSAKGFGWKQAYPGKNVFTATEDQLYLTTRKRMHKLSAEGVINTTANVVYNIAHGLAYAPFCIVYVKSNTTGSRFKVPRFFPTALQTGPDSDDINAYVEVNTTNLRILTTENAEVYYRIFLDEIL